MDRVSQVKISTVDGRAVQARIKMGTGRVLWARDTVVARVRLDLQLVGLTEPR